jgi:hypothetical protein
MMRLCVGKSMMVVVVGAEAGGRRKRTSKKKGLKQGKQNSDVSAETILLRTSPEVGSFF